MITSYGGSPSAHQPLGRSQGQAVAVDPDPDLGEPALPPPGDQEQSDDDEDGTAGTCDGPGASPRPREMVDGAGVHPGRDEEGDTQSDTVDEGQQRGPAGTPADGSEGEDGRERRPDAGRPPEPKEHSEEGISCQARRRSHTTAHLPCGQ